MTDPTARSGQHTADLFDEILALAPNEQVQRLDAIARHDSSLASLLARLIGAAARANTSTTVLTDITSTTHAMPPLTLAEGDVLGDFTLRHRIGLGGMGEVWIAEQRSPTRRVALKVIDTRARRLSYLASTREREALAAIRHPAIATIHAAGETHGVAWIAMELVEDARDLVTAASALPLVARIALLADVADGVAHAHAVGFIHRDRKPSNVLVGKDGRPKVIDFGIALAEGAHTDPLSRLGTPAYLAPEALAHPDATRAETPHIIDARADVRALGVLLYQCVHETLPRELTEGSPTELLARLATVRFEPPANAPRETRGDLAAIVRKATAADPASRYPTVAAFADDLRAFLARRPVRAAPRRAPARIWLAMRRHPFAASVIALSIAALLFATAASMWSAHRARQATMQANALATDISGIFGTFIDVVLPRNLPPDYAGSKTIQDYMRDRVIELEKLAGTFLTPHQLKSLEETASVLQYACTALGMTQEARRCAIARALAAVRVEDPRGAVPLNRHFDDAIARLAIDSDDPAALEALETLIPQMIAEHDIVSTAALFRVASVDHLGDILLSSKVAESILRSDPSSPELVITAVSRVYLATLNTIGRREPLDPARVAAFARANERTRTLVDGSNPAMRTQAMGVARSLDFHFARMLAVTRAPTLVSEFVNCAQLGSMPGRLGTMETIGLRLLRVGEVETWRAVLAEIDRRDLALSTAARLPIERARAELVLLDARDATLLDRERAIAEARRILLLAAALPLSEHAGAFDAGEVYDRIAVFERQSQLAAKTGDIDAILADIARLTTLASTARARSDTWAASRYDDTARQLADMLEVGNWETQ